MKMRNAELYLKGATVIYGFSKIARTNVKVEKTKPLISLKAFLLLITFIKVIPQN